MTSQEFIETEMPHMEGWCSIDKAKKIVELVKDYKPDVSVEIGVFAGRSLFAAGFALRDYFPFGVIYGIDPWMKEAVLEGEQNQVDKDWWSKLDMEFFYDYTLKHLKQFELENYVQILRGNAEDFLEQFQDIPIEYLHIDGNHSELSSCRDVETYVPLVSKGFPIIMDDVNWKTTEKAQTILKTMADSIFKYDNEKGEAWEVFLKR